METIILTGAFGNVGQSILGQLITRGYPTRIFELETKRNHKIARHYAAYPNIEIVWGDLRDYGQVAAAMAGVDVVLHIGAIIPPLADKLPELAEAVNVGGTRNVIQAAQAQPSPPKLLYTSSISIYGDRRDNPFIKATDPLRPGAHDTYGQQKLKAETLVRQSGLDWCVFRLTYITSMDKLDLDPLMFSMPLDTCIEICDTKDVGLAAVNAIETPEVWGKILNIAGGGACRTTFGEYLLKMLALFGLGDNLLPADAFSTAEFHCGWMDTRESQELLQFQRTTLETYYEEVKHKARFTRFFARGFRPLARWIIAGRSPYFQKLSRQRRHLFHYVGIREYLAKLGCSAAQVRERGATKKLTVKLTK